MRGRLLALVVSSLACAQAKSDGGPPDRLPDAAESPLSAAEIGRSSWVELYLPQAAPDAQVVRYRDGFVALSRANPSR